VTLAPEVDGENGINILKMYGRVFNAVGDDGCEPHLRFSRERDGEEI
jgi:hypothetical protein